MKRLLKYISFIIAGIVLSFSASVSAYAEEPYLSLDQYAFSLPDAALRRTPTISQAPIRKDSDWNGRSVRLSPAHASRRIESLFSTHMVPAHSTTMPVNPQFFSVCSEKVSNTSPPKGKQGIHSVRQGRWN